MTLESTEDIHVLTNGGSSSKGRELRRWGRKEMIEHREGESYYKENLRPNIAAFDTCLVEMCDCFIFFLKNKEGILQSVTSLPYKCGDSVVGEDPVLVGQSPSLFEKSYTAQIISD